MTRGLEPAGVVVYIFSLHREDPWLGLGGDTIPASWGHKFVYSSCRPQAHLNGRITFGGHLCLIKHADPSAVATLVREQPKEAFNY